MLILASTRRFYQLMPMERYGGNEDIWVRMVNMSGNIILQQWKQRPALLKVTFVIDSGS